MPVKYKRMKNEITSKEIFLLPVKTIGSYYKCIIGLS